MVAAGGKGVDGRLHSEFQKCRIEGSVNIPLYFIRLKLNALDKNTQYVVCCDTGRRSSAAAYILSERGFEAYILKGVLAATEERPSHKRLYPVTRSFRGGETNVYHEPGPIQGYKPPTDHAH